MKLWLNGTIADAGDTRIDPRTGLLLGDELFETMLVQKAGLPFRGASAALMKSAGLIGLAMPYAPDR